MEDETLLASLTTQNEEELKSLDAKIEDAEKNQGETEGWCFNRVCLESSHF
jgi:hypothetical protein